MYIENSNKKSGELISCIEEIEGSLKCETDGGTVHVEWDDTAPVTPFGQFVFFAHFLKSCNLFHDWVDSCPALSHVDNETTRYKMLRNLLGSYLLTVLAGHKRYAHITAIRHDQVNPGLLGMTKVYSEDTIRRAFRSEKIEPVTDWMKNYLAFCYAPLLEEEWIMDIDTTVKCLYGHQEGAEVAYNPKKPGRPSHVIHTYMQSATRLILDCEVQPGTQGPSTYSMPRLLEMLDGWPSKQRPSLLRGDCAFGNEKVLAALEERDVEYLFKMKQSKGVKSLIQLVSNEDSKWEDAGQGWEGTTGSLKLQGWSIKREVIVLRKLLKDAEGKAKSKVKKRKTNDNSNQLDLPGFNWKETLPGALLYEYAVLVTSLNMTKCQKILNGSVAHSDVEQEVKEPLNVGLISNKAEEEEEPISALEITNQKIGPVKREAQSWVAGIAQLYRDRATCENNFDELKNQWGWGGFVTQDLFRSQVSARIIALIYNWWTLFTRWIDPAKHREGITSRPLMLHGVGRKTSHAGKPTIKITSLHAKREKIQTAIGLMQRFLQQVKIFAQQKISKLQKWILILSEIFTEFLQGRILSVPSG